MINKNKVYFQINNSSIKAKMFFYKKNRISKSTAIARRIEKKRIGRKEFIITENDGGINETLS